MLLTVRRLSAPCFFGENGASFGGTQMSTSLPPDGTTLESGDAVETIKRAFRDDNAELVRKIFEQHPEFKARINDPIGPFCSPAIINVRSAAMLDALLDAGADINARSRWWAGGFGLLDCASPELAAYAIKRGATVDAHAAARLGMFDRLRELISASPASVNARGGDGQTPLHFASTVEIADYLLDHGADIDIRDIDHESTPAQYMVENRQEILRRLIGRGCKTDLLMAAALGNVDLARKHLEADPACIRIRVTDECFPKSNPHSGGTIYQWKLGWYVSPHQVAKQFGHHEFHEWLISQSPADVKLMTACWECDEGAAKAVIAEHPDVVESLSKAYRRDVANAARNNNLGAVKLMLASGLPVDSLGQHRGTPLHWAAWHGNVEMVGEILRYHPPLENAENDYKATPLNWAVHGSENGWHREDGDYAATVEALASASAKLPSKAGGTEAVGEVLRKLGVSRSES
jgi:ankyrin repeat protein